VEEEIFELSDLEYEQLNSKYPHGKGSGLIGFRSEEIIKLYFRRKYPDCKFSKPKNGADLEVIGLPNSFSYFLEVKGTADSRIAWQKLKVSSEHSYKMLTEEKIPLYRVTSVFDQNLSIYILKYEEDFILEPEPRWSIKKKNYNIDVRDVHGENQGIRGDRKMSSKYLPLTDYLKDQNGDEITFLFSDAQKILGFSLPKSAKQYQAFWANQADTTSRPWAKAWQDAGFYVESFRLSGEDGWVIFKRGRK